MSPEPPSTLARVVNGWNFSLGRNIPLRWKPGLWIFSTLSCIETHPFPVGSMNRTSEQMITPHECWQWSVWGMIWVRRVIPRSLFSHRALFISSQLSFCAVFYGLSQLVSSWSRRKIHHVSPNHQSAGGGEPFFFCVVLLYAASKKNSTDAAGTRSSLWPSRSSEALQRHSSAPHHTSGLAVRSSGAELRRRRGGLVWEES